MTVYELIGLLAKFPPDTRVTIVPQKRGRWSVKDQQRVYHIYGRGLRSDSGEVPAVEICGSPIE